MKAPLKTTIEQHMAAHVRAWEQAALDATMGDIVENTKRFGLVRCFTEPYGEFLDPVETMLARLRELAGTT